jgi:agmatinase
MTKEEKINAFDPNGVGLIESNIFGLPFSKEESDIVLLPVPWEVTVSYSAGTADGPLAIFEASKQVDLYDIDAPNVWKSGIYMLDADEQIKMLSDNSRAIAEQHIEAIMENIPSLLNNEIDIACKKLNDWVEENTSKLLQQNKIVGLIGGDHSTPLGYLRTLAKKYSDFGILQIDAHCDLRDAYEGFEFSHASIMFNALKIPQISKLVQVGIRDFCEAEVNLIKQSNGRIQTFFDYQLKESQFEGESWKTQVDRIVKHLPKHVYISFDIDGLDPKLCPSTGTPVAGGLEYQQAVYLIKAVQESNREIIGFDLNEVAPGETEWDANVAARLLYKMCVFTGKSKGLF